MFDGKVVDEHKPKYQLEIISHDDASHNSVSYVFVQASMLPVAP